MLFDPDDLGYVPYCKEVPARLRALKMRLPNIRLSMPVDNLDFYSDKNPVLMYASALGFLLIPSFKFESYEGDIFICYYPEDEAKHLMKWVVNQRQAKVAMMFEELSRVGIQLDPKPILNEGTKFEDINPEILCRHVVSQGFSESEDIAELDYINRIRQFVDEQRFFPEKNTIYKFLRNEKHIYVLFPEDHTQYPDLVRGMIIPMGSDEGKRKKIESDGLYCAMGLNG